MKGVSGSVIGSVVGSENIRHGDLYFVVVLGSVVGWKLEFHLILTRSMNVK
jgi:hypothetical protein